MIIMPNGQTGDPHSDSSRTNERGKMEKITFILSSEAFTTLNMSKLLFTAITVNGHPDN